MSEQAPLRLSWARLNALGMRDTNQDTVGEAVQDEMNCFVIADGAGGHAGGEIASRIVVDSVLARFRGEAAFGPRALLSYVGHAIANVARDKQQAPERHDMSATVAALLLDPRNQRAVWAHLGDTRVYQFRGGRLHAVSKDHSLTQQLIDAGYARADQLRIHPQRNILFAAIGAEGETPVAASEIARVEAGDAFLLCSDGLWEWALEEDMERTLAAAAGCEDWLAALCAIADANAQASARQRDNYSAYAVMLRAQETAP
jgi:serine/threonine protein phosphatase PrpC